MLEHVPCQNVRFWVVVLCDLCIFSWPHLRSAAGICMPPTTPANPYWPRGALPPGLRFVSNTIILCITKNGTIWIISAVSPGWNSDGESLGKFKTKKNLLCSIRFSRFFLPLLSAFTRRGYGCLVSYNVPPYARAGLYKESGKSRRYGRYM